MQQAASTRWYYPQTRQQGTHSPQTATGPGSMSVSNRLSLRHNVKMPEVSTPRVEKASSNKPLTCIANTSEISIVTTSLVTQTYAHTPGTPKSHGGLYLIHNTFVIQKWTKVAFFATLDAKENSIFSLTSPKQSLAISLNRWYQSRKQQQATYIPGTGLHDDPCLYLYQIASPGNRALDRVKRLRLARKMRFPQPTYLHTKQERINYNNNLSFEENVHTHSRNAKIPRRAVSVSNRFRYFTEMSKTCFLHSCPQCEGEFYFQSNVPKTKPYDKSKSVIPFSKEATTHILAWDCIMTRVYICIRSPPLETQRKTVWRLRLAWKMRPSTTHIPAYQTRAKPQI